MVGTPGALRDRGARPGPQGALLRPGLLRTSRPSSSGPGCGRWPAGSRRSPSPATSSSYEILDQSVIVLRGDDGEVRAFQNACRHRGVRLVRGPGTAARRGSPARSTAGATARTAPTPTSRCASRSASTTCEPGDIDLTPGALRAVGRVRVDQPRRRRAAAAGVHRAGRHHPRRLEGRVAAHRVVVRLPPPRELEARPAGVPGAVPRGGGPPAAGHPRHAVRGAGRASSTRGRSSTPRSATCTR